MFFKAGLTENLSDDVKKGFVTIEAAQAASVQDRHQKAHYIKETRVGFLFEGRHNNSEGITGWQLLSTD